MRRLKTTHKARERRVGDNSASLVQIHLIAYQVNVGLLVLFDCRAIDEHKEESETHRAAVRRRSLALRDADAEYIDDIVGIYASHSEVR